MVKPKFDRGREGAREQREKDRENRQRERENNQYRPTRDRDPEGRFF